MKKLDLKEVINFVRWHYLDERLSIVAKHLYDKKSFDIIWTREDSEPEWTMRDRSNGEAPRRIHTDSLLEELNREKVDLIDFEMVMYNKVLLHVAHLNFIIKKATDLFGPEIIKEATSELSDFYSNLQGVIDNLLGKPEDKLDKEAREMSLKDGQETKSTLKSSLPKRSSLRLIKEEVNERKDSEGSSQDS